MSDKLQKKAKDNASVDKNGIRLAPVPINDGCNSMPIGKQQFVLEPKLNITASKAKKDKTPHTQKDFQPIERDVRRPWKRKIKARNCVAGVLMFLISAVTLLPYILGAFNQQLTFLPFAYTPTKFNVIGKLIEATQATIALGGSGAAVNAIWISAVPYLILTLGILGVLINTLKAVIAIFGTVRPKKYYIGAIINLLAVVAIIIASLVGADNIGIAKIEFLRDLIYGWQTSELVTMTVLAAANVLFSVLAGIISPKKAGY